MTIELEPGELAAVTTIALDHESLPADQIVAGSPTAGVRTLDERGGRQIGVWEMTPGTATDTEVDELFIVLAGRATVRFDEVPGGAMIAPLELTPGALVRLTAGMRTTWTVHETLRKVYLV